MFCTRKDSHTKKNYVAPGKYLTHTHNEAVASGQALLIGAILGIAASAYAANESGDYSLEGIFQLPVDPAVTGSVGEKAYWDAANSRVTDVAAGAVLVGVFAAAKPAAQASALVRLNGVAV